MPALAPDVVHSLPGRLRVRVPDLAGRGARTVEQSLRTVPGIHRATANPYSDSILILFDSSIASESEVLAAVERAVAKGPVSAQAREESLNGNHGSGHQHAIHESTKHRSGKRTVRARVPVRGMDCDPRLASEVVDRLHQYAGVHAKANLLTGRVLIEFEEHRADLEDLLCEIANIELPSTPGEDHPHHPLDPLPLNQSGARVAAAGIGLAVIGARRVAGAPLATASGPALSYASALIGVFQGLPSLRRAVSSLLGRNLGQLVMTLPDIVISALTGSPLSLVVNGSAALRLYTEVSQRREVWKRYENRLAHAEEARPGVEIRLESGERVPLPATVVEGFGTSSGQDGIPVPVAPGTALGAGSRLNGGPFVVQLGAYESFEAEPRPGAPAPDLYDHYLRWLSPVSLSYAALTGLVFRSFGRGFEGLLLMNARAAFFASESANLNASARVMRAGVIVVGTRTGRHIRLPQTVIVTSPRALADGVELTTASAIGRSIEPEDLLALGSALAVAAGSPWGAPFRQAADVEVHDARFHGGYAIGRISGCEYRLGPGPKPEVAEPYRKRGQLILTLLRDGEPIGFFAIRPRIASGALELGEACKRLGVELVVLSPNGNEAGREIAKRVGAGYIESHQTGTALHQIRKRQAEGLRVAVVSDSAESAELFEACDLGIGLSLGRSGRFPARADLLAPDVAAVASILVAARERDKAVRDGVIVAAAANAVGAVLGLLGPVGIENASRAIYLAAIAAMSDSWYRLKGGDRPSSQLHWISDPMPERTWGNQSPEAVLSAMRTTGDGLTSSEAERRLTGRESLAGRPNRLIEFLKEMGRQFRSPLVLMMSAGALFSLYLGSILDFALIAVTVLANVAFGAWQQHEAGEASKALDKFGAPTARVLRDGAALSLPASHLVHGDVLLLQAGDRVAADARLIWANGLEVDEAALTGESLTVSKAPEAASLTARIVLEGSDVTVGAGRAVVVAIGSQTRLGTVAASLALQDADGNPLGERLSIILRQFVPLTLVAGGIVFTTGIARGGALSTEFALGAALALAALPDGLPLLAGIGEVAVARRLAERNAIVRRLGAVEALGRVDIACTDKTGTLTEGKLRLVLVARPGDEWTVGSGELTPGLHGVLLTAGLAGPHPHAPTVSAHPTDLAVLRAAQEAGLDREMMAERLAEAPFEPSRSFHAAQVEERTCFKGAMEVLAFACTKISTVAGNLPMTEEHREQLLSYGEQLAGRGLRVLMVADGPADVDLDHPAGLTALGFVGIEDPLRPGVQAVLQRCREAGIRVIMLTGDHPETARTIAVQAGLIGSDGDVVTGAEIAELQNGELADRLERTSVIARVTPLDKLRIVETLQARGHAVAMTGDGVNDAPALRLADVGVAMGRGGTEVARQAADVILADDNFSTLVEALVEGRSFWRNVRRAIALLLGGNVGELSLVAGSSILGLPSPLGTRQILAMNLITDAIPALAVALQEPEHRNLAELSREGTTSLEGPLKREVIRRGVATLGPSMAAYVLMLPSGLATAQTVAFATAVMTQLAQTVDAGRAQVGLTPAVMGAAAASGGLMFASLLIPALRTILGLTPMPAIGWLIVTVLGGFGSVAIGRMSDLGRSNGRFLPVRYIPPKALPAN